MPIFTAIVAVVTTIAATTVGKYLIAAAVNIAVNYVVAALFTDQPVPGDDAGATPAQAESMSYASVDVGFQLGSRQQLSPGTTNKLPVVYGATLVKPIIVDAKISKDQKTMFYVCALSEAPSAGNSISFTDPSTASGRNGRPLVYWGDKRIQFKGDDYTMCDRLVDDYNGGQADDKYDSKIQVWLYNDGSESGQYGAPNAAQVLDSPNIDPESIPWTNTTDYAMHRCAFAIVRVKYDQEIGLTGLQELSFYVNNSNRQPGNVIYDYLTNARYGCGLSTSLVDTPSFSRLNTYSAKTITYNKTNQDGVTTAVTGPRFEINGSVDTTKTNWDNLLLLAKCCDSWLRWDERVAKWAVVVNQSYTQAGLTINDLPIILCDTQYEDIGTMSITGKKVMHAVGGLSIQPIDLNATYNKAEVQYINSDTRYSTSMEYLSVNSSLLSANEPENQLTVQVPFATNAGQALFIGKRRLAQSREDLVITVKLEHSGIQLEAGDIVRIYHKQYGWTSDVLPDGKLFRVTEIREEKSAEGSLGVQIAAFEYNNDIFEFIDINSFLPKDNTALKNPNIFDYPKLLNVSDSSEASVVPHFIVNAVTPTIGITTALELWYYEAPTGLSSTQLAAANFKLLMTQQPKLTPTYEAEETVSILVSTLPGNLDGMVYYIKVRALGTVRKSPYSQEILSFKWNPIGQTDDTSGLLPGGLSLIWNHNWITSAGTGTHSYQELYSATIPTLNADAPPSETITYDIELKNWSGITDFTWKDFSGTETTRLAVLYKIDPWTSPYSTKFHDWKKIAVSTDGMKMVAVPTTEATTFINDYLYKSVDAGLTWTELTASGQRAWTGATISDNGLIISAVTADTNAVYRSINGGTSFTTTVISTSYTNYSDIASSVNGTTLAVTCPGSGTVFTSSNSGATWTKRFTSAYNWQRVCMNSNGTIMYAYRIDTATQLGYLYISTNSGVTWVYNSAAGTYKWTSIACNQSGDKCIATSQGPTDTGGIIYVTTNTGATWSAKTAAGSRLWTASWINNAGSIMYATDFGGYVYSSKDSGANWSYNISSGQRAWSCIAGNPTTSVIIAGGINSYLYRYENQTEINPGLGTWRILAEVDPTVATWTYALVANSGNLAIGNDLVNASIVLAKKESPVFAVVALSKTGADKLSTTNSITLAATPTKTVSIKRREV